MQTIDKIRQKFLDFYKHRAHSVITGAPLIPENDSSTLFTSSGMQPLLPYFLGQTHPAGKRVCNCQKCFRSVDIEEVGDARHSTFFEMLGNWSFGDYFKKEQLPWVFDFFTSELGLDPQRLYVSVYAGNKKFSLPRDDEAIQLWQAIFAKHGIAAKLGERIFTYGDDKNWWSRSGTPAKMPPNEPGGADSEIFYDFGSELGLHQASVWAKKPCHPNCDCGRFIEIGNSVFMQYQKQIDKFVNLPAKNVDYGGGLERALMAVENQNDLFQTSLFAPIMQQLTANTNLHYASAHPEQQRCLRIIADHLRSGVMLMSENLTPSNKEQGYLLRRLIRRSVVMCHELQLSTDKLVALVTTIGQLYAHSYPEINKKQQQITSILQKEVNHFQATLEKGIKRMQKTAVLDGETAFFLYESYGFPWEITQEIAAKNGQQLDYQDYLAAKKHHQQISKGGEKHKFKSGLADHQDNTIKFHTAAHLLLAALRKHLDDSIRQKGSNITSERARFDFNFPQALSAVQLDTIGQQINDWIKQDLPVSHQIYDKKEALDLVGGSSFAARYPDKVTVFQIGQVSQEICTGPHVTHTGEIPPIKISKQGSAGAGVRRLYLEFSLTP